MNDKPVILVRQADIYKKQTFSSETLTTTAWRSQHKLLVTQTTKTNSQKLTHNITDSMQFAPFHQNIYQKAKQKTHKHSANAQCRPYVACADRLHKNKVPNMKSFCWILKK